MQEKRHLLYSPNYRSIYGIIFRISKCHGMDSEKYKILEIFSSHIFSDHLLYLQNLNLGLLAPFSSENINHFKYLNAITCFWKKCKIDLETANASLVVSNLIAVVAMSFKVCSHVSFVFQCRFFIGKQLTKFLLIHILKVVCVFF